MRTRGWSDRESGLPEQSCQQTKCVSERTVLRSCSEDLSGLDPRPHQVAELHSRQNVYFYAFRSEIHSGWLVSKWKLRTPNRKWGPASRTRHNHLANWQFPSEWSSTSLFLWFR